MRFQWQFASLITGRHCCGVEAKCSALLGQICVPARADLHAITHFSNACLFAGKDSLILCCFGLASFRLLQAMHFCQVHGMEGLSDHAWRHLVAVISLPQQQLPGQQLHGNLAVCVLFVCMRDWMGGSTLARMWLYTVLGLLQVLRQYTFL
jgi:hypothetical protein